MKPAETRIRDLFVEYANIENSDLSQEEKKNLQGRIQRKINKITSKGGFE